MADISAELCSLLALEHFVTLGLSVPRNAILEILSSATFPSPPVACCVRISFLLRLLKREGAVLDLTSMYSLETIEFLAQNWLSSLAGRPLAEVERHRQIASMVCPDDRLLLDTKLCLVYDMWTGNPLIGCDELKAYISEQVFVDVRPAHVQSRDECLRAAENRKDPFRSAIWSIASRNTINERLMTYCQRALDALGTNRTMLERIVDDHIAGRYHIVPGNPVYGEVLSAAARPAPPSNVGTAGIQADGMTLSAPGDVQPETGGGTLPGMARRNSGGISEPLTISTESEASDAQGRPQRSRRRRRNVPWTEEEERALKRGVVTHGPGSWAKVHREHQEALSRRTQIDLKDKWRNMCRNKSQEEIDKLLSE